MALLSGLGRLDFPLLALDSLQPGSLSPLRSFGKAEPVPSTGDFVHLEALLLPHQYLPTGLSLPLLGTCRVEAFVSAMDSAALEVLLLLQSCSCLDAVLLAFDSARSNSTLSPHSLSGPGLATSSFGPACLETLLLTPDVVSLDPSLLPRSIS